MTQTDLRTLTREEHYGSAAPVAGTWVVGDRVWNSAPAAEDPVGWVCSVAGTPGTWLEFGGGGGSSLTFMGSLAEVDVPRTDESNTWVQLTAHASANTKGSYATLIASSSADATMMRVRFQNSFVTATQINQLCDIAVGAAASESVIVANIQCGSAPATVIGGAGSQVGYDLWFPVNIPAGSRVSARIQDAVGSDTVDVHVSLYGGGLTGAGVDTIGANTAASAGTQVTAGANTWGSWTQITASAAEAYRAMLISLQMGEGTISGLDNLLQVGVGASSSEVAIYTLQVGTSSNESVSYFSSSPIFASAVAAGARLSVRMWGGIAADIFQVALHGVK